MVVAAVSLLLLVSSCGTAATPTSSPASDPGTTADTGVAPADTTIPLPTTTIPPAKKVLLVGDSSGVDTAPAIGAMLATSGVELARAAGPGFGLTRQGISDVDSEFRTDFPRLLDEEHPDLVIVLVGVWDQNFVETRGEAAYADVVDQAATILTSKGARVMWMAVPPGGKYPDRRQNGPFQEVAARHPGRVFYVDYEQVLRGPDGTYPVSYVAPDGTTVHLRKADGWHFCQDGAERVAQEISRVGVADGLLPPAVDGWQNGTWRRDAAYDFPECG